MKHNMQLISIGEVLSSPEKYSRWFCLPLDVKSWTLDTKGAFTLDARDFDPDSEEYLPEQVRNGEWITTLEAVMIEDIVMYTKMQIESPSLEQLLEAFIFYFEEDAFMDF